MVGLIGAMHVEMEALINDLEDRKTLVCGKIAIETGTLYGIKTALAICGPGKVNAAVYADTMIHLIHPDWVINLGVAGALSHKLGIGDIVLAESCVQHDMDTSAVGDPVGFISGIGEIYLPCDTFLNEQLRLAAAMLPDISIHKGVVASGDQFICAKERKSSIQAAFSAIACEMEGGAIAHACYMHGIPVCIVRSISDKADESAQMDYPEFVKLAAANSTRLIRSLYQLLRNQE